MPAAGFDSAVTIRELRVILGANDGVGDLNEQGLDVGASAGNAGGFHLARALVVAGAAANPGAQMLCRWEHGHIRADFRNG